MTGHAEAQVLGKTGDGEAEHHEDHQHFDQGQATLARPCHGLRPGGPANDRPVRPGLGPAMRVAGPRGSEGQRFG